MLGILINLTDSKGKKEDLYSAANDPETANDPRPQMIPKLDRK